jgi:hypothetical protein
VEFDDALYDRKAESRAATGILKPSGAKEPFEYIGPEFQLVGQS